VTSRLRSGARLGVELAVDLAVRSRLIVNTAEAAIDAAIAGLGITRVLSYQVAASVKAGDCGHRIDHPPAQKLLSFMLS
jgi:DNA-binding transcriptional LysR family regulator